MRGMFYGMGALTVAGLAAGGAQAHDPTSGQQIAWATGSHFDRAWQAAIQTDSHGEGTRNSREIRAIVRRDGDRSARLGSEPVLLVDLEVPMQGDARDDRANGVYVFADGHWDHAEPEAKQLGLGGMLYGGAAPLVSVDVAKPGGAFADLSEALGTPETLVELANDSDKVTVFTPRVAGTQLGVSYTPEACQGFACGRTSATGLRLVDEFEPQTEVLEFGLNYVTRMSGVDLAFYGAYGRGDPLSDQPVNGIEDQDQWDMGLSLGYGSWLVAARYRHEDPGVAFDNLAREDWTVGLQYQPGPWRWGVQYLSSRPEGGLQLGQAADALEIGGAYDLAPGMLVTGGMQFWDVEDPLGSADDGEDNAIILLLGTAITF